MRSLYFTAVLRSFGNSTFQAAAMLAAAILNAVLDPAFIRLFGFRGTAQIVRIYFLIVGIGYGFNTVTNCHLRLLNGFGKPSKSMFRMIFYYIIIRMPLAYFLPKAGTGITGIWVAILVSHLCAAAAAISIAIVEMRKSSSTAIR